jgi:hypothetical protein
VSIKSSELEWDEHSTEEYPTTNLQDYTGIGVGKWKI